MTVPANSNPESARPRNTNTQICFTKQELVKTFSQKAFSRKTDAQNARIHRTLKRHILLPLKNGFYITTESYLNEPNKTQLTEYIATKLYSPSYISGEYVLRKYGMLGDKNDQTTHPAITCITKKSNRHFENQLGDFIYQNIRSPNYDGIKDIGIRALKFRGNIYHIATKARALFDYLYLHHGLMLRNQKQLKHQLIGEFDIQWGSFTDIDFVEFDRCVWRSNSKKMMDVLAIMRNYLEERNPGSWLKDFLEI